MMVQSSEMTAARRDRQTRDRELRRQDFLNAAERVFARRGYHEAGMEEIAEEAGYAIGTVYRYFTSKKELYHTLLEAKAMEHQQRLRAYLDSGGSARDRIGLLIRDEIQFVRQHQDFLRVLVAEVMANQGDLSDGCRRMRQEHRKNFLRVIEEGMISGEFREVDKELAAVLLSRSVEMIFHEVLGTLPAGPAFDRTLAKIEAFMFETMERLLLPL